VSVAVLSTTVYIGMKSYDSDNIANIQVKEYVICFPYLR
jgi:hypothetical protein